MIIFECPNCKKKLQAAEQHAGKSIKCPSCQAVAKVPSAVEEAAATGVMEAPPAPPVTPPEPPATAVTTPEDAKSTKSRRDRDEEDDDEKSTKSRRKRDEDEDEDDEDDRPRKRRRDRDRDGAPVKTGLGIGMIMLIICGIGFCCVGPILIALLVPAVQKVREAAARTQSTNNLKQIALGFHAYHDVHRDLPFNGTQMANPNVPESGSWAYQILPFVEQAPMFQQVNRNAGVPTYMCPGRSRPPVEIPGGAWTDYFYNNYLNEPDAAPQPNPPNKKRTFQGIADGTSNTIMVGHGNIKITQYSSSNNVAGSTNIFEGGKLGTMRGGDNGKSNPGGCVLARDSALDPNVGSWGGPFPSGGLMSMADGSVRIFPYNTPSFSAFLTPSGGEQALLP